MGESAISGFLRKTLGSSLYRHSRGVSEMAVMLADFYGAERDVVQVAGLWHDYGKSFSFSELKKKARVLGFPRDSLYLTSPQLLHAPLGAALICRDAGIRDLRVLRAVYYHTTGASGLRMAEKIVYLADAIEENRSYPGVEKLRKMAFIDFEAALLEVIDNTIKRVILKDGLLHPHSVAFRNEMVRR